MDKKGSQERESLKGVLKGVLRVYGTKGYPQSMCPSLLGLPQHTMWTLLEQTSQLEMYMYMHTECKCCDLPYLSTPVNTWNVYMDFEV